MPGLTNTSENEILNFLFSRAAYTPKATYYVGLSTSDPGETGVLTGEPSGGSYARKPVTNDVTNFPAAVNGSKSNGVQIAFAEATGTWGVITHFFLADALVAGNIVASGALLSAKSIESGDVFYFDVGDLTITMD